MRITLTIPGNPIAKARPRFARVGKFVKTYNCQETEEGKFKWELLRGVLSYRTGEGPLVPKGVPVSLRAIFYMPIPTEMSKKKLTALFFRHVKKPDTDNLLKFLKDCGNGILWADDSQVCEVRAGKLYDEKPRTYIEIQWGDYHDDKKHWTMDETYHNGSDHIVCEKCGLCVTCGDCRCDSEDDTQQAEEFDSLPF